MHPTAAAMAAKCSAQLNRLGFFWAVAYTDPTPGLGNGASLTIKGKNMKQFTIKLNDIKDVKNFVTAVNAYTFDVDLVTGRYITDAKSIMGVLSLDLEDKLLCVVHTDDSDEIAQDLEPFIVNE